MYFGGRAGARGDFPANGIADTGAVMKEVPEELERCQVISLE
jgi:hypothetical protein